jgi:hypothetical protein
MYVGCSNAINKAPMELLWQHSTTSSCEVA